MEGYKQVTEHEFLQVMDKNRAHKQKGMPYDHLKLSGKTGFYKVDSDTPCGFVERLLGHHSYYINTSI